MSGEAFDCVAWLGMLALIGFIVWSTRGGVDGEF